MTAHGAAAQPPARGRYAVITEALDTRVVTEYATHAEAVLALEQEVDRLQADGATIEGDPTSGYTARWVEHGLPVSMRLTLART